MWFYLALLSYFLNAFVYILDKYLLASPIPKPYSYSVAVASLSTVALVLIPFGVVWQGWFFLSIALLSGGLFFLGLNLLYQTIVKSDVSVAATSVGTFGAIFTLVFSVLLLDTNFNSTSYGAFIFLLLGILFLGKLEGRFQWSALLAGLIFGLSYALLKWTFNTAGFINGIFWTRMGFVGLALVTLVWPPNYREVFQSYRGAPVSSRFIFIGNKVLAAAASITLYFAIKLGEVSFVNALLGTQFLFTFLLAVVFKDKLPSVRENLDRSFLKTKLAGIICILIGFILLYIYG
jgi:drug/metabolite transporter (DMT)-like permease